MCTLNTHYRIISYRRQTIISRLYPISRSPSCPVIKTSMRRNLTTTVVFDELVVKGDQAHQRRCLCHHMLCCGVDTVKYKLERYWPGGSVHMACQHGSAPNWVQWGGTTFTTSAAALELSDPGPGDPGEALTRWPGPLLFTGRGGTW